MQQKKLKRNEEKYFTIEKILVHMLIISLLQCRKILFQNGNNFETFFTDFKNCYQAQKHCIEKKICGKSEHAKCRNIKYEKLIIQEFLQNMGQKWCVMKRNGCSNVEQMT